MHIHFIAIGGAIMHQLAIISKQKGYIVSGSDDEIADPAKTNLEDAGLLPQHPGWYPEKITSALDAVILGMHAREDNPELLRAQELKIPIYSFPEYIYRHARNKRRVVIAGSHGKTTTTSMVMHVLRHQDMDFDYLVGARIDGFDHSVRLTDAPVIILEGDEYPASALEKKPKIHFYHPHIAVLTGIAWDHINVFPTYDIYFEQFRVFLKKIEVNGELIYNAGDREVVRLIEEEKPSLKLQPYATPHYDHRHDHVLLPTDYGDIALNIFGVHNLQNLEAARKVCNSLGVSDFDFYDAIQSFHGAARRLEKINDTGSLVVYRDFAHAPSKLKATLEAAREQYPGHRLVAAFELHTFSSLSMEFLKQYANSMDACDNGAVFYSQHALMLKKLPAIPPALVKSGFENNDLRVFEDPALLHYWIEQQIAGAEKPVCLLLMSSGTFEGMGLNFGKQREEHLS
ncbi:MAG TPA: Mur ligase family protein [Edaphocola sp.]|nr:Mur ligase family protein [Edaphocola sp.]